jgi:hypothetical protein
VAAGNNLTYNWDLGDGSNDSGQVVAHTYPGVGSYTAVVTVSNSFSLLTATTTVTVFCQPVLTVEVTGSTFLFVGENGVFTATHSPPTATIPLTFTWDNGTVGPTATYSWATPGTYTLAISGSNLCGSTGATFTVQVLPPPPQYVYLPIILASRDPRPDLTITAVFLDPNEPNELSLIIANWGREPALTFWIEGYLDPLAPPEVNQTWSELGCTFGLAWFVDALYPGEQLTLTIGDAYFQDLYSRWPEDYPYGDHHFWAFVDMWGPPQPYGAVEERDEGNNRYGPLDFSGYGQDFSGEGQPIPLRRRYP